ncbi:hypothetical protein KUL72_04415 [Bradyrhizobium arachidis]|uniref:hypothetical protein n=1 Tax=Bradyrhizobium arachidis TaxID=858423 RepID=UPI002161888C|nr:hypothetical protein [Bradyrhizobium arachidis]UVO37641.1 hypothetical protein KUL72_04415 [Bradyrhizobium arachidis]
MGKKTGKTEPAKADPVYVIGLDAKGKPRGARFAELKDSIVSAAMDLKCRVLINPPEAVSALGMKLPMGRVYGGGKVVKLFVPNIRRELYDKILEAAGPLAEEPAAGKADTSEQASENTQAKGETEAATEDVRCISPVTSGLPRGWEEITVGHMVLAHESPDDGWWEAVVIKREDEILTLRYRDAPKLPKFIRHINTVALVNPGPG